MFSWARCVTKPKIPLKLSDSDRKVRFGVNSSSLKAFKIIANEKLKIDGSNELSVVFEEDGTEIEEEEIFAELPPQTVLMVLGADQHWHPAEDRQLERVEAALSALLQSNRRHQIALDIKNKIDDVQDPELLEILGQVASTVGQNIQAETRDQDPDWFKGQPPSKKTKRDVMRECAKRRVRKYYNTAVDHVKSTKKRNLSGDFEEVFENFQMELRVNDYYGDYFDRKSRLEDLRLCEGDGWFSCEGSYDVDKCASVDHQINPYGSRGNYLVFSTWNLDHRIEKSREVLPKMLQAQAKIPRGKQLNWIYFYDLLFTRENLRIVHPSCHDKTEHDTEKCDPKQFYT